MKVGLLFDRECQPAWIVAAVRKLQQDPDIHIDYVVILSQETKEPAYSQQHWLYRLYQRIDARFMAYLPDSWSLHNIGRLFTTEQVTTLAPDSLANPLTNKWAANPPEIALYFGESLIDRNRLLMLLPHYGILTLLTEQGTSLYSTAKWAVFSKAKTASAAVWQLADDPADDRLLALTTVAAHRFSVRWTEHVLFNKATELLRYQLFAVVQGEERPPSTLISQQANIQILPISLALMRLAVRFFASIIYDVIMPGRWILAIRSGGSPLLDDLDTNPLTRLKPPVGFQWADPFLWEWQNQRYIFFEEIPPTGNKAHISVVELTEHDAINFPAAIAICQDYHMSYPFLFSWQGTLFMMPQTTGNKSIEIYRCTKFPQEWVLEKQFFEGVEARDSTLAEINGQWWLFTYLIEDDLYSNNELSIFYADTPFGPWTPHKRNPVVSDVRHARPAGGIFQDQGRYYRPAQDCSGRYGYAVVINEILELTASTYTEKQVTIVRPDWASHLQATHTLNHHSGNTIVDGYQRESVFHRIITQQK